MVESVILGSGRVRLLGELNASTGSSGVILFAHGSGSGRLSPRNTWVANRFNQAGFSTLLVDLLTEEEAVRDSITMEHRFDVQLLGSRVILAAEWLKTRSNQRIGYYGASTGASAALIAAAEKPEFVSAIVSRGGRPDLAESSLPKVEAPTLLIVGGLDYDVLEMNREAQRRMRTTTRLEVVEGATHLFEERGKLEEVARLSVAWFTKYVKMNI
jgi:putative phosphoribosyl transferase